MLQVRERPPAEKSRSTLAGETIGRRQQEVQVGAAQDRRVERGTERSGDPGGQHAMKPGGPAGSTLVRASELGLQVGDAQGRSGRATWAQDRVPRSLSHIFRHSKQVTKTMHMYGGPRQSCLGYGWLWGLPLSG